MGEAQKISKKESNDELYLCVSHVQLHCALVLNVCTM